MTRWFFILTFCLSKSFVFGQLNGEGYKTYSALISLKIRDTSKSIAVVKKLETDSLNFYPLFKIINEIKSENLQDPLPFDPLFE